MMKEFTAFEDTYREETFEHAEVNKRFQPSFKEALMGKTYRQVRSMLAEYTHCPIIEIKTRYSKEFTRVKDVMVYGHHSTMWIYFDKHTRKVSCVW